jgi:hypothetical protein
MVGAAPEALSRRPGGGTPPGPGQAGASPVLTRGGVFRTSAGEGASGGPVGARGDPRAVFDACSFRFGARRLTLEAAGVPPALTR